MKKIMLFLLLATTGFAENLVLENQTSYPTQNQKSKIAIQWATSAKEVDECNKAIMYGLKLNPATFQVLTQPGNVSLNIPKNAACFRVLVWSKGEGSPDFHTNWVDVLPNKTYTLKTDHLVPSVLISGSGC
ncbi:MAG TPA: hypothetical protein VHK67_02885 [Rhabdochlamydiaceae bacterium]|jgi:hypothetical protein|nr:hypothetical protein [Rhabdochlamydiaceae bacterium]